MFAGLWVSYRFTELAENIHVTFRISNERLTPDVVYLFKFNNGNPRTICEVCSRLAIETLVLKASNNGDINLVFSIWRKFWYYSIVFIVDVKHFCHEHLSWYWYYFYILLSLFICTKTRLSILLMFTEKCQRCSKHCYLCNLWLNQKVKRNVKMKWLYEDSTFIVAQPAITCSKLTIETEHDVKYVQSQQ